jgi:hypothetical protein
MAARAHLHGPRLDVEPGKTEDRCPDIFGLASGVDPGGQSEVRATVAERVNHLPRHGVRLGTTGPPTPSC